MIETWAIAANRVIVLSFMVAPDCDGFRQRTDKPAAPLLSPHAWQKRSVGFIPAPHREHAAAVGPEERAAALPASTAASRAGQRGGIATGVPGALPSPTAAPRPGQRDGMMT